MVIETVLGVVVALRDAGTALLLVEEKSKHVLSIADSVAFLELGRIRWTGVKEEVDERALAQAHMGAEAR